MSNVKTENSHASIMTVMLILDINIYDDILYFPVMRKPRTIPSTFFGFYNIKKLGDFTKKKKIR